MTEDQATGRQKRVKRAEVRRRLLAAAFDVFAERGYDGASLERVADLAGFSKGAVYSNFANKDELFFELVATRIDQRIAAVRIASSASELPNGAAGVIGIVKLIGTELAEMGAADPAWQMLFIEFWLRCTRNQDMRQKLAEKRRLMRLKLAEFIENQAALFKAKVGHAEAMDLATTVLALSNGLGIEGLIDAGAVRPELFGEILAKTVVPLPQVN